MYMVECTPKRAASKKINAPWIDKELITLCRRKRSLYKKAKRSSKVSDWEEYRKLNNSVKRACNLAQRRHVNSL